MGRLAIHKAHSRNKRGNRISSKKSAPRKWRRHEARTAKAVAGAPRPSGLLKPLVFCQTLKYHKKLRLGRGFSRMELKLAGINPRQAKTIGIAVDVRSDREEERNVLRIRDYFSKIIIFEEFKLAVPLKGPVMPIKQWPRLFSVF